MLNAELADRLEAALEGLTFRQMLNVLMRSGVPAVHILGMDRCADHVGWAPLTDVEPLAFDGTVRYCKEGVHWVRS
jgi:hypothetical protein